MYYIHSVIIITPFFYLLFKWFQIWVAGWFVDGSRGDMQQQHLSWQLPDYSRGGTVSHGILAEPDLACGFLFCGQFSIAAFELFLETQPRVCFLSNLPPMPINDSGYYAITCYRSLVQASQNRFCSLQLDPYWCRVWPSYASFRYVCK